MDRDSSLGEVCAKGREEKEQKLVGRAGLFKGGETAHFSLKGRSCLCRVPSTAHSQPTKIQGSSHASEGL